MPSQETSEKRLNSDMQPECIIVSNRSPVEYYLGQDGNSRFRFSAGGLVTGLLSSIGQRKALWIALSPSEAHLCESAYQFMSSILKNVVLRLVKVSPKMYKHHYVNICNRILWPTQHSLLQTIDGIRFDGRTRSDWEEGYTAMNHALADAVIEELKHRGSRIPILFQDYHLYLAAEKVRMHFPDARISHTTYIPWPEPRYFSLLPTYMSYAIYRGLTANDILGFQTVRDLKNFHMGAEYLLKDARLDWEDDIPRGTIYRQGRSTILRLYPVAVSCSSIYQQVPSREIQDALEELKPLISFDNPRKILLRVDRIEPIKNIIRGFEAYERLLQVHPELCGTVIFLALLVPSRQSIVEYRAYERRVRQIIQRINVRYGQKDWLPIVGIFDNNRARAIVCLQNFDVLLVNSVVDGMNLVVKEGGLLNKRDGVIVLSHTTGVHDTVGSYTLSITPLDIESTASALYSALSMCGERRADLAVGMRAILLEEDASLLMDKHLADLHKKAE